MFPEFMIRPMREELTRIGLEDLRTPEAVDAFLAGARQGTALIAVNSTCGCAAGSMRPGLRAALDRMVLLNPVDPALYRERARLVSGWEAAVAQSLCRVT